MATFYGPPPPSSMHYMTLPRHGRPNRLTIADNGPTIKLYTNAVYYPNWRVYAQQTPKSLRLNRISHVFYAFAW
jgi:GH18 family chitinase